MKNLKVGDRVWVIRQIGQFGTPQEVTGTIDRFTNGITIGGEKTAIIKYDDGRDSSAHPLSKIHSVTETHN